MSRRKRKGPATEAHVRLYAHETRSPAWQTLEPDARALLVELRARCISHRRGTLFTSRYARPSVGSTSDSAGCNVRSMRCLRGVDRGARAGRVHVQNAARHALSPRERTWRCAGGDAAQVLYAMASARTGRKFTVVDMATVGSCHGYRAGEKLSTDGACGSRHGYRQAVFRAVTVVATATQIYLPIQGHLLAGAPKGTRRA